MKIVVRLNQRDPWLGKWEVVVAYKPKWRATETTKRAANHWAAVLRKYFKNPEAGFPYCAMQKL